MEKKRMLYGTLRPIYRAGPNRDRDPLNLKQFHFQGIQDDGTIKGDPILISDRVSEPALTVLHRLSKDGWVAYAVTRESTENSCYRVHYNVFHLRRPQK